jgi:putative endonuclease
MNDRAIRGKMGEDAALEMLLARGLILRDRNWRAGKKEIDLIMENSSAVHFIEVRTRTVPGLLSPAETINSKKTRNVISAASYYMKKMGITKEAVFDFVSVEIDKTGLFFVEYIENAYNPDWR